MNIEEARIALASVGVADYRLRNLPPSDAEALAHQWVRHLFDVPLDWVLAHIDAHYRDPEPVELTSGRVLAAYRSWQAHQRAAEEAAAEGAERAAGTSWWDQRPPWFDAYRAACDAAARWPEVRALTGAARERARAEALRAVVLVPVPAEARPVDATVGAEQRARRCAFYTLCACDHTHCRDGWLDDDEPREDTGGGVYPVARRCSFCNDALLMAEEQGLAKKPSHRPRRRAS